MCEPTITSITLRLVLLPLTPHPPAPCGQMARLKQRGSAESLGGLACSREVLDGSPFSAVPLPGFLLPLSNSLFSAAHGHTKGGSGRQGTVPGQKELYRFAFEVKAAII